MICFLTHCRLHLQNIWVPQKGFHRLHLLNFTGHQWLSYLLHYLKQRLAYQSKRDLDSISFTVNFTKFRNVYSVYIKKSNTYVQCFWKSLWMTSKLSFVFVFLLLVWCRKEWLFNSHNHSFSPLSVFSQNSKLIGWTVQKLQSVLVAAVHSQGSEKPQAGRAAQLQTVSVLDA